MEQISPPKIREFPASHRLQVEATPLFYGAGVAHVKLIEAIAITARRARQEAGLKQSRIAAALDADQSTVTRFEKGNWPQDVEAMIDAYAEELEIPPAEILIPAVELWAAKNGRSKK